MSLEKITTQQMDAKGVCAAPDVLSGTPAQNKAVFDRMVRELIAPAYNAAVDAVNALEETESGIEAAEALRVAAEELRAAAETARAEAESGRAEAEQQRQDAETQRQDLETGYVARSENGAKASESWAVGGTGTREGEDTNNAKYWSEQAAAVAGGGVISFKGRTGSVIPASGDYTAEMVGAYSKEETDTLLQNKADKSVAFTVTLTASGWADNAQTISNANFLSAGYAYTVSPASGSFANYAEAMIYADDVTTNGQMVFHCDSIPTENLTVNIVRMVTAE